MGKKRERPIILTEGQKRLIESWKREPPVPPTTRKLPGNVVRKYPPDAKQKPRSTQSRPRTVVPPVPAGTDHSIHEREPICPPVLTSKGLETLRKIEQKILDDPNCFTLRACCESIPDFKTRAYPEKYPKAGIIACLAGLACLCIANDKGEDGEAFVNKSHAELADVVAVNIGLTTSEAHRLFAHWSFDFVEQYRHSASQAERAQTAINRIEKFIRTGE